MLIVCGRDCVLNRVVHVIEPPSAPVELSQRHPGSRTSTTDANRGAVIAFRVGKLVVLLGDVASHLVSLRRIHGAEFNGLLLGLIFTSTNHTWGFNVEIS